MKKIYFFHFLFLFSFGVLFGQTNYETFNRLPKKYVNTQRIHTLKNKPINFYLNHTSIDSNSKKFYRGELAISNNEITYSILDSALTKNQETRPFYFFILNKIVELSGNDISGMVSERSMNYVKLYPCEFFRELNQPEIEINVVKWTTYLGQSLSGGNKYALFRNEVDTKIRSHCNEIYDLWKSFNNEVRMCVVR